MADRIFFEMQSAREDRAATQNSPGLSGRGSRAIPKGQKVFSFFSEKSSYAGVEVMVKQIVVEDDRGCKGCPHIACYSMGRFASPPNHEFYFVCTKLKKEAADTGFLPDCPLPDVQQHAASPWLPMDQAPKDGKPVMLANKEDRLFVSWFFCGRWWVSETKFFHSDVKFKCFAHIHPPKKEGKQ
jgi:hypothetical protein